MKTGVPEEVFETLCGTFYNMPQKTTRRINGEVASPVFAISRNPVTRWVQLLIDEDTPVGIRTVVISKAKGLSDDGKVSISKPDEGFTTGSVTHVPIEKPRGVYVMS